MTYRKKLIEVALPLEAINSEAAGEKTSPRGHPSTLHLWWARRPLAACRAVLFGSLVDDPSSRPEEFPTESDQQRERKRLFRLIEELVKWENVNNERVLEEARAEILKSTDGNPPPVLDPFCGGGSIPLEAQRLGLEAHGSVITKAIIEIPPRFAGQPPVNSEAQNALLRSQTWKGATGLAEDVHYYGKRLCHEAEKRIGHLYPKVQLPKKYGGSAATVIAWLWARTVKCPNPACGTRMPLVKSFWLSKKQGNQAWLEPIVDTAENTVRFEVKTGNPDKSLAQKIISGTGFVNERGQKVKSTFRCIVCDAGVVKGAYIDAEANARRMGVQPLAIVAEGNRRRAYVSFDDTHKMVPMEAEKYLSDSNLIDKIPTEPARGTFASNAQGRRYGFQTFGDYFTCRQLIALTTFSDLVSETRERVEADAIKVGCREAGGYADAVVTYLAFAIDRVAMTCNTLARWNPTGQVVQHVFGRQALPMVWDFADANVFASATGSLAAAIKLATTPLSFLGNSQNGFVNQFDAASMSIESNQLLISTDPPYYDNVAYADLSDFFYVWLRRSLRQIYSNLFNLMLVPKTEEIVATPFLFGGDKSKAEEHFLTGLSKAFHLMRRRTHPDYPMTVYYGFKQSEKDKKDGSFASTGWETMLEGLLKAGFLITGTLPMRTEMKTRQVAMGTNALASSIVLVCRPRSDDAKLTTRRDFISALRRELPDALRHLQEGNIAPVDLAQAAIGPGMGVFSRYRNVLEADGSPMRVRTALQIINAELDAYFTEQEGDLDPDTRFCTAWFEQHGMAAAAFGEADVLARAKNSSVERIAESGILQASAGKVRLLSRDEYPDDWNPTSDIRLNTWKCAQYLIRTLDRGGEVKAARLVNLLGGGQSERARGLAYRLYALCERKGWVQEAVAYNTLATSWSYIQSATTSSEAAPPQRDLF